MSYRVLDNTQMNTVSSSRDGTYAEMVESALNNMERGGYLLVAIEEAASEHADTLYIFQQVTESVSRVVYSL